MRWSPASQAHQCLIVCASSTQAKDGDKTHHKLGMIQAFVTQQNGLELPGLLFLVRLDVVVPAKGMAQVCRWRTRQGIEYSDISLGWYVATRQKRDKLIRTKTQTFKKSV